MPRNPEMQEPDRSRILESYDVLRWIGRGASADVYEGIHRSLQRRVALKLLASDDWRARMIREGRFLAQFSSDFIIRVHDFVDVLPSGRALLVLEWVDGQDLRSEMTARKSGRIDLDSGLTWMEQVAKGMIEAHSLDILHRDLKPENIIIERGRTAKIADFGLAFDRGDPEATRITQLGQVIGTPDYAPPESFDSHPPDVTSDIYGFGATYYHALSGVVPFPATSNRERMKRILVDPVDPAPLASASIPPEVIGLLVQCLDKRPEARPRTFREVLDRVLQSGRAAAPTQASSSWQSLVGDCCQLVDQFCAHGTEVEQAFVIPGTEGARHLRLTSRPLVETAADAWVSFDDELLTMKWGIASCIREVIGPGIASELDRYGKVRPGRAVVTGGGDLVRFVVHAVAGTVDRPQSAVEDPKDLMNSVFFHLDSLAIRKVAIPVQCPGYWRLPGAVGSSAFLESVMRLMLRPDVRTTEVILALQDVGGLHEVAGAA